MTKDKDTSIPLTIKDIENKLSWARKNLTADWVYDGYIISSISGILSIMMRMNKEPIDKNKKTETLTLHRSGDFKIFTFGNNHCGTLDNQNLKVYYHLTAECENILDKRGFLFEQ